MMRLAQSWGGYPRVQQNVVPLMSRNEPLPQIDCSLLAHGNGRSYGDSCLNPDGTLLHTRPLDRFIHFDPACGALRCEAGVTLDEILRVVLPQGWFLPVTPGTRFVTVGGAIANDVHGKNHHRAGTFGHHVVQLELLRSDGSRLVCSRTQEPELFCATIAGLGLTGVITWAEIQLKRVRGPWMDVESLRFDTLPEFFELSADSGATHEYTVAWIDCLARGKSLGRGHFIRADHASGVLGVREPKASHISMPLTPPFSLVNRLTLRPFNQIYYHCQLRKRHRGIAHYLPYFYPLDSIDGWNRMYGPKGFLQHQCVLPPQHARDATSELLREIARTGLGSFLAVLKEFGSRPAAGMLSFPRPGTTLALDFPNSGPSLFALLDRLDTIVHEAGGAVYPAKDARMSGAHFKQAFPRWKEFQTFMDPRFSSGFWRRVME